MNQINRCPQCGACLPQEGASCPRCLLATGLEVGQQPRLAAGFLHDLPLPGDMLVIADKYRVLETIGRGAMGVVYKASQENLDRVVAVKMLTGGALAGEDSRQRFVQEAKHAASLRHPNIVTVFDWGEDRGQPYFSMEFVEGRSLAELVREGPLEVGIAVRFMRSIAGAVGYAHELGIVHRDLKPSNVLVDALGEPKVADFGLAKHLGDDAGLTLSGQILGTPGYLSPEQTSTRHGSVGPLSDVYALGALFYCLLTGKPPFSAGTIPETLRQVSEHEPVPPCRLNPSVPRDLETICLKCLEKEPKRRYSSAAALAEDLARWQSGEPIHARPVRLPERVIKWGRRHPSLAWAAAAALLFLLLGLGGLEWGRRAALKVSEMARSHAAALGVQLEITSAAVDRYRFEKVHRTLDRGAREEGLALLGDLLRRSPSNSAAVALAFDLIQRTGWRAPSLVIPVGNTVRTVCFSPDGREVLTSSANGEVRRWSVETAKPIGKPIVPTTNRAGSSIVLADYSPSGRQILTVLVASTPGLAKLWDVETEQFTGQPMVHGDRLFSGKFSEDGRWVLTVGDELKIWDATTGQPEGRTLSNRLNASAVSLSPDGQMLAIGTGYAAKLMDWKTRVGRGRQMSHENLISSVAFSPDGSLLLTASWDSTARLWDAQTGEPVGEPMRHPKGVRSAAFSPDGLRILTCAEDNTARIWNSATQTLDGPPMWHKSPVRSVSYSPDGSRIVAATGGEAYIWDLDSHQAISPLHVPRGGNSAVAAVSPDGAWIGIEGTNRTIARVDQTSVEGTSNLRLHHEGAIESAEFVQGTRCIISSAQESRHVVAVSDGVTGIPIGLPIYSYDMSAGELYPVSLSRDGRFLLLSQEASIQPPEGASGQHTIYQVWDVSHAGKVGKPIEYIGSRRRPFLSKDGRRLVTMEPGRMLQVVDSTTGQPIAPAVNVEPRSRCGDLAGDDRILAIITGSKVSIINLSIGLVVGEPMLHDDLVISVELSPDAGRALTLTADGTTRTWDTGTGRPLTPPSKHSKEIAYAGFGPDGREMFVEQTNGSPIPIKGDYGNRHQSPLTWGSQLSSWFVRDRSLVAWRWTESGSCVRLWDRRNGNLIGDPIRYLDRPKVLACSGDGTLLLISELGSSTVSLWSIQSDKAYHTCIATNQNVLSAQFSPDRERMAITSADGTVSIRSTRSETHLGKALKVDTVTTWVGFTPDGSRLITASKDGTVRVWDAETLEPVGNGLMHETPVQCAACSPDGRRLLCKTEGGRVWLWDIRHGESIMEPIACPKDNTAVDFVGGGDWIGISTGSATRWVPLPPAMDSSPEWLPAFCEAVGGLRLDPAGGFVPADRPDAAALFRKLDSGRTSNPGSQWLQWMLSPAHTRTIAPGSLTTVSAYSRGLMTQRNVAALTEAVTQSPTDGPTYARLALTRWGESTNAADRQLALFHSKHAVDLAPESQEVAEIRLRLLQLSGRFEEAWKFGSNAVARFPKAPEFRVMAGAILAEMNRRAEASELFGAAVSACGSSPAHSFLRCRAMIERYRAISHASQTGDGPSFAIGCGIPARPPGVADELLDLSDVFNASLTENWMGLQHAEGCLIPLSKGIQQLADCYWDIRGVAQIDHPTLEPSLGYPSRISGIRVGRTCLKLQFLYGARHAMASTSAISKSGRPLFPFKRSTAYFQINRDDGTSTRLPLDFKLAIGRIDYAQRSPDWYQRVAEAENGTVSLDCQTWSNPEPGKVIKSIDLVGNDSKEAVFLLAITLFD